MVVEEAVRSSWAWAWCTIVRGSFGGDTIVSLLAPLALGSFGVVLAEQASAERVAASWRVIVALTWWASGDWLTVIGASSTSITDESRLASLALVSFSVVLAVEAVTVLLVTLGSVSVALALLAETQVESTTSSGVAWGAVFARGSDVAGRADALLHLGRRQSLSEWLGVLDRHGHQGGLGAVVQLGGLDEESVEVGESHQKMFPSHWLPVNSLELVLEDLDLDGVLSVGWELFAVGVLEADVVSSEDDMRILVLSSGSRVLEGVLQGSTIGGHLVVEEFLWKLPIEGLSVGLVELLEVNGRSRELCDSLRGEWMSAVRGGQRELITISTTVIDINSSSSVVTSATLLCDTGAEAWNASLWVGRGKSERVRSALVAIWSDDGVLATALSMAGSRGYSSWSARLWSRLNWDTSSEVWSVSASFVAWCAVLTRGSNVSWWTGALFYLQSQSVGGVTIDRNLPADVSEAGGCLAVNMCSSDKEGVEVGEHHQKVFSCGWLTVQLLVVVLIGFDSDSNWAVRSQNGFLVTNLMDQNILVSLENDHWTAAVSSMSRELNLELHLTAVRSDLVSEESLWQTPILGDTIGSTGECNVSGFEEIEWGISLDVSLLDVRKGDSFRVSGEHETILGPVESAGSALVGDSEAEALQASLW